MRTLRQMLAERTEPPRGRSVVAGHDLAEIRLAAARPLAFQLDGEYMGEVEEVRFRSVPRALRVIGLSGAVSLRCDWLSREFVNYYIFRSIALNGSAGPADAYDRALLSCQPCD